MILIYDFILSYLFLLTKSVKFKVILIAMAITCAEFLPRAASAMDRRETIDRFCRLSLTLFLLHFFLIAQLIKKINNFIKKTLLSLHQHKSRQKIM